MTRVLCIDDEAINHDLVARALEPLGFQTDFASNGNEGIAKARELKPDLIITDVMMPDLNGYEVTRQLRRETQFAVTPILILTAQSGLQDKLKAFEAGADDYLTKPFEGAELAARVTALLRRLEASDTSLDEAPVQAGRMLAFHSLRGGTGCSTLAVNLGIGLATLWPGSTMLLDLTMTAGQVALMLNMTLRRTWTDIARYSSDELDLEMLKSIIAGHESGLQFIAAPTFPAEAENLESETLGKALRLLKDQYGYVVADLPHDFSEQALLALDLADTIMLVGSPDMASLRAITAALDTYKKLGYPPEKIKLVLSATFPHSSLTKEKIENALGTSIAVTIPYVPDLFVDAINLGQPPVFHKPEQAISGLLEDLAFFMSNDSHKKSKPEHPSDAWKRVYKRHQERKK